MEASLKKALIWIGALVVVLVAVLFFLGRAESRQAVDRPNTANVGEFVRVGNLKWTSVSAERKDRIFLDTGRSKAVKPDGVFVILELKAELTGSESDIVDARQFAILDYKGKAYQSTSKFSIYSDIDSIYLKQVTPDAPVTGKVIFDLPDNAQGLKLEIKDLRRGSGEKGYFDLGF
ncbi:MAG: DUF4352 domain-containing protein [Candidatus Aquicultorales bacterium]